jgi:hypothetical protein
MSTVAVYPTDFFAERSTFMVDRRGQANGTTPSAGHGG